jgi:hypothetical protein
MRCASGSLFGSAEHCNGQRLRVGACGLGANWSGLHYTFGAFLAGAIIDSH